MIKDGLASFKGQTVLLLQGPVGPFFRRLAQDLRNAGARVHKVNFNGGDCLFYRCGAIAYRGSMQDWPEFFQKLLQEQGIDFVILFGDCRPIHRPVHDICRQSGVETGVFEEGYERPDYVTLERSGVNGYSLVPSSPDFYLQARGNDAPPPKPCAVGNAFLWSAVWAILYYLGAAILRPWFSQYQHHRPLSLRESWPWLKAFWRKYYYRYHEQGVQQELTGPLSGSYFLLTLQVHNDTQVIVHSQHETVAEFIAETIQSFAEHAPTETLLVIKHHPLDRGYHDYTRHIQECAAAYQLGLRVRYIHDQHLPTLLTHARGAVMINSTVGLSALYHGKPVKACGTAIYDIEGLTYQGPLDTFWKDSAQFSPNTVLFQRFRDYLVGHTQLNGNFYKRLRCSRNHSGLIWN